MHKLTVSAGFLSHKKYVRRFRSKPLAIIANVFETSGMKIAIIIFIEQKYPSGFGTFVIFSATPKVKP